MRYRAEIDGLRAVAVLAVIFYHLRIPGFRGGFVGVDVFFVISGYLITSVIAAEMASSRFSLLGFYNRRIRRILPALFAVLAFAVPVAAYLMLPYDLKRFGESVMATAGFVSNILFWAQSGYFAVLAQSLPLLHTWSLGIEEQFYVVYPLLLALLWRWDRGRIIAFLAALTALSFAADLWATAAYPTAAFLLAPFRAWELGVGCIAALAPRPKLDRALCEALTGAGLVLILMAVAGLGHRMALPDGMAQLLPVCGALLVIVAGDDVRIWSGAALRSAPAVLIGKMSYSAYLWHWPLIAFASYYLARELHPAESFAVLLATAALSAASWRWIEQPARHAKLPRAIVFAAAAVATLFFAGVGFAGYRLDGWPGRFPELVDGNSAKLAFRDYDRPCFVIPQLGDPPWVAARCTDKGAAPDAPVILLWGDSQAAHYYPGLHRLQQKLDFTLVTAAYVGCGPLSHANDKYRDRTGCIGFQRQIANAVSTIRPDLVILSARWDIYDDEGALRASAQATIGALRQAHIRVLVIGPSPIFASLVPLIDLARRRRAIASAWERPLAKSFARGPLMRQLAKQNGAAYFSPEDVLCNNGWCRYSDGQLFYWDTNHFSVHGSVVATQAMEPLLRELLPVRHGANK